MPLSRLYYGNYKVFALDDDDDNDDGDNEQLMMH